MIEFRAMEMNPYVTMIVLFSIRDCVSIADYLTIALQNRLQGLQCGCVV